MNQRPDQHPAGTALAKLIQARNILQEVVTSSESFNYPKAKAGIAQLERMIRDLGREEARLRGVARSSPPAPSKVIPFPPGGATG